MRRRKPDSFYFVTVVARNTISDLHQFIFYPIAERFYSAPRDIKITRRLGSPIVIEVFPHRWSARNHFPASSTANPVSSKSRNGANGKM